MEAALIRDKFDVVLSEDHGQMQEEASDSEETPCTSSDTDGEGVGTTVIIYRVLQKKCTKFMHHHFATVRHRVMQFSTKCSEINCLHDKTQCLNLEYGDLIFFLLQLASKLSENKISSKIFKADSWYKQSLR